MSNDMRDTVKRGAKAVSAGNSARMVTAAAATAVGVTVAAPALVAVGVVTGLFSFFGDD
ncbi:MAG: hypothetical protein Q9O24_06145 [Gammaproteobacteria bacterium]|nr:hypothetical protein [Gammaproteobacteria bacterium]